ADRLVSLAVVVRGRVREAPPGVALAPAAVHRRIHGEIDPLSLPPPPGHEPLAAQMEGPGDEAGVALTEDALVAVERPHVEAAAVRPSERLDERKAVEPPLEVRLGGADGRRKP